MEKRAYNPSTHFTKKPPRVYIISQAPNSPLTALLIKEEEKSSKHSLQFFSLSPTPISIPKHTHHLFPVFFQAQVFSSPLLFRMLQNKRLQPSRPMLVVIALFHSHSSIPIMSHSYFPSHHAWRMQFPHFALFFAASASLLVASSSRAVSTAPEGRWTYRTTEPRINMSFVEHCVC